MLARAGAQPLRLDYRDDNDAERILSACGADLPLLRRNLSASLESSIEQLPRGDQREPEQTKAFRRVLQGEHEIVTARDGSEALRVVLGGTRVDAIICDIGMEPMDGLAFTATVRALPGSLRTPVVLVSGQEGAEVRARGAAAGADGYVSKCDCSAGRLLAEVSAVLSRRGAQGAAA